MQKRPEPPALGSEAGRRPRRSLCGAGGRRMRGRADAESSAPAKSHPELLQLGSGEEGGPGGGGTPEGLGAGGRAKGVRAERSGVRGWAPALWACGRRGRRPREPGAAPGSGSRSLSSASGRAERLTSFAPSPTSPPAPGLRRPDPVRAKTRGPGPGVTRPPCLLPQMLRAPAVLCVCAAAWCAQALAVATGRPAGGSFLDDKQWLSTVSQYDREAGQWNRFRDVSRSITALERAAPRWVGVGVGARGREVGASEAARCWGRGVACLTHGVRVSPGLHSPLPAPRGLQSATRPTLHGVRRWRARPRGSRPEWPTWEPEGRRDGVGSLVPSRSREPGEGSGGPSETMTKPA